MFSKIAAYQPDTNLIMNGDLQISVPNCSTNGCNIKSILKNSWISKNTDLGSLIGNTQCGNFRIYLPQIILLETNFVHFEAPKTSILTIWADLNFELISRKIRVCRKIPNFKLLRSVHGSFLSSKLEFPKRIRILNGRIRIPFFQTILDTRISV